MKLSEQYERKLHKLNEQIGDYITDYDSNKKTTSPNVKTKKKEDDVEESGGIMDILNSSNAFGIPISAILGTGIGAVAAWKGRGWWQKITGKKIDANKLGFFKKNGLTVTQFYNKIYRDPKYLSKFQKDFGLTDSDIKIMLQDWQPIITERSKQTIDKALADFDSNQITAKQFLKSVLPLMPRGAERRNFILNLSARLELRGGKTGIKSTGKILPHPEQTKIGSGKDAIYFQRIPKDNWMDLDVTTRINLVQNVQNKIINPLDVTLDNAKTMAKTSMERAAEKAAADAEQKKRLKDLGITGI